MEAINITSGIHPLRLVVINNIERCSNGSNNTGVERKNSKNKKR